MCGAIYMYVTACYVVLQQRGRVSLVGAGLEIPCPSDLSHMESVEVSIHYWCMIVWA